MNFPLLLDGQRFATAGIVTGSSTGTALTHVGTAHTKGAYAQLIASTTIDAHGFLLYLANNSSSAARSWLVDLAIGASSSEQVIVPNLLVDSAAASGNPHAALWIPIPIPAGTRLSARQQGNTTTGTLSVAACLLGGGFFGLPLTGRCSDMGTDTADSNGTVYDPGASINTKGGYTQLSASTPHDIRMLMLAIGSNRNSVTTAAHWLMDVAIGAAASEQVVIPNLLFSAASSGLQLPAYIGPIPCTIPAGSRLSINAQCSINDATDRKFAVAAYGIG